MNLSGDVQDLVGLIPAAGSGSRIPELPFSKALYPLPESDSDRSIIHTPIGRLLHSMQQAGADRALIVSRRGCTDIIDYVGNRSLFQFAIAHVITEPTPSVPHTLCTALPFLGHANIILGLPDIVFKPKDALKNLVARRYTSRADVVLGLFPTDRPDKSDMVEINGRQEVVQISVKTNCNLRDAWVFAVWTARFSEFLADFIAMRSSAYGSEGDELELSEVFIAAQRKGLSVLGERFPSGRFLDLGTRDAVSIASRFFMD